MIEEKVFPDACPKTPILPGLADCGCGKPFPSPNRPQMAASGKARRHLVKTTTIAG
jgi:hypothetical protein